MADCPCGAPAPLRACCGRFLYEGAWPATAEQLMRARYTAYARRELGFLVASQAPESRVGLDQAAMQSWAQRCTWQSLQVIAVSADSADEAFVEFRARYLEDGQAREHHERSRFRRHRGRWYYCEGSPPAARAPGRNQRCACGSGRKTKHCCGG